MGVLYSTYLSIEGVGNKVSAGQICHQKSEVLFQLRQCCPVGERVLQGETASVVDEQAGSGFVGVWDGCRQWQEQGQGT